MSSAIIDFEEERSRHGELFGREDVLERLLGWLVGEQARSSGWVLLLGSPGIGKSALVDRLLELLPAQTPYHLIRRGIEDWDRPEAVVQNLCARIEQLFPEKARADLPSEARLGDLLRNVSKRQLVPYGRRLIVVIDGLDEAASDGAGRNPLPRFLPRIVPAGVVLLCASRPLYPHLDWIAPDNVRTLDLDDDAWARSNEAASRAFCAQRARRISPPLDAAVVEAVVRSARGNMLHASSLCEWLDGQPPARRTTADIAHGHAGLLRRIWSELHALDGARRTLILKGLGLACAAREALPAYVFGELLGDPTTSDGEEFLRATRHLLREEPAHWHDGRPGYRLYHEYVREVLITMLGDPVIRDYHLRIIEVLAAWPSDKHDPARRRYALRHAVAHRLEAGNVGDAQRLCTDMNYLEAKCRELDIMSIEREIEAVAGASDDETSLDLTALLAALRAEASRLSAHPRSLPALIHNRLRCAGWASERIERVLGFNGSLPPLRLLHGVRLGPTPLRTFLGHDKPIVACVVTPDGRHALTAAADRTLRFWALVSGEVLAILQGHDEELTACALTPDGGVAVSTSIDMTARLWDLATGRCLAVLDNGRRGATACAVSQDARYIFIGSDNGVLTCWDRASLQRSAVLEGHSDYVTACLMTPAGQLVSASRDQCVHVWDLASGECVLRLSSADSADEVCLPGSEQGWITALALLPEGGQVLAVAGDGTISRWALASGRCVQRFGAGQGRVDALTVLHGGSHVLCGMADGTLAVWDLAAGRRVLRLPAHAGAVSACAVTSDGRRIVSASSDRLLRLWDLGGPESMVSQDGHAGPVTACALTPDGRVAVSASEDRILKVWDTTTGACRAVLSGHADLATACAMSTDGHRALSGARDGSVLLWTLDLDRGESRMEIAKGHRSLVSGCAFLSNGRIITASQDGTLWIRSLAELDRPVALGTHNGSVDGIALTPDSAQLLSISRDGTAKLWDLAAGRCTWTLVGLPGVLLTGALTPDGRRAVLAFADGRIEVRDLRSQQLVRVIRAHARRIFGCAVSADGKRVLSASEDGTVQSFSLETGRCLGTLVGTSWFRCLATAHALTCAGDQEGNLWMIIDGSTIPGTRAKRITRERDALSAEDVSRLRDALARLYGSVTTALLIVKEADIDARRVNFSGSPREFWSSILDEAIKQRGRIDNIVRHALRDYSDDDDLREVAEQLGR